MTERQRQTGRNTQRILRSRESRRGENITERQ